jgi:hypothetical protein
MSGGELYELQPSAPLIDENGSSLLLPTPLSQDDQKQPEAHLAKKVESGAGATITSLTVMSRQFAKTGEWSNHLLLPTPTAHDATGPDRHKVARGSGGNALNLTIEKFRLAGATTPRRSPDGNESTERLPCPPTIEAA